MNYHKENNKNLITKYKTLINNAYEKYQNEDYVNALTILQNAVEVDDKKQEAYFYFGLVYLKTKQYPKAVQYFNRLMDNIKKFKPWYKE